MSSRSDKHIQLDRQDLLTIGIPVKEGKLYHLNGTKWCRSHLVLGKYRFYVFDINHRGDEEVLSFRINASDLIKVDLHDEIMKEDVCFVVVYGEGDTIVLACDSETTRMDWMNAFKEVIHSGNNSADSDFCSGGLLHSNTRKESDYDEILYVEDEDSSQEVEYRTEDTVESELSCKQPDAVYSCVRKKSSATKLETPYTRELMGKFCKDVTVPFNKRMIERVPEPEQKVTHEVNSEQRAKGNTNQGDPTYASVSASDSSDHVNVNNNFQRGSLQREERLLKNNPYDQIGLEKDCLNVISDSGSQKTGYSGRKASDLSHGRDITDDTGMQMECLKLPIPESDPVNNCTDELKSDPTLCGNVFGVNSLIDDSNCSSTPDKALKEENDSKPDPEKQSCQPEVTTAPMLPPRLRRVGNQAKKKPQSTMTMLADSKQVLTNTQDDPLYQDELEKESQHSSSDESYESTNSTTFEKDEYICEKLNKNLLRSKPVGTFCVLKVRGNQELVVKTDDGDNISKFQIMEENGTLYLKKSDKFQSLEELLKHYSVVNLPTRKFKVTLKQGCFRNPLSE